MWSWYLNHRFQMNKTLPLKAKPKPLAAANSSLVPILPLSLSTQIPKSYFTLFVGELGFICKIGSSILSYHGHCCSLREYPFSISLFALVWFLGIGFLFWYSLLELEQDYYVFSLFLSLSFLLLEWFLIVVEI